MMTGGVTDFGAGAGTGAGVGADRLIGIGCSSIGLIGIGVP